MNICHNYKVDILIGGKAKILSPTMQIKQNLKGGKSTHTDDERFRSVQINQDKIYDTDLQ